MNKGAALPLRRLPVLACLLAGPVLAGDDPVADLKQGQPREVRELIERLVQCAHFGGEEGYDAARRREIESAMKRLRCDRVDRDEAAARKRYAAQPRALEALRGARALIE